VNNLKLNIMEIGNAVKAIRKKRNETQCNFAKQVGITQTYLSQVENGHKKPSMDVIEKIASATDTPLPILFWFGITEDDVESAKLDMFKLLKPAIDGLIDNVFN
jgi:transcriptional regulator with XRE-family HTH domain